MWCKRLRYCINKKVYLLNKNKSSEPSEKKTIEELRSRITLLRKKNARSVKKNNKLQDYYNELQSNMKEISDKSLEKLLEDFNIPKIQTDLIFEIVNASKMKNSRNRKYSENWLFFCSLFLIKYSIIINNLYYYYETALPPVLLLMDYT